MAGKNKGRALPVALCAVSAALGVAIIYLGGIVDVLDISAAVIASVGCMFAAVELGGAYPWLVYAVTGTLSLVLVPNPSPSLMYILLFGYYPIVKLKLDKKPRLLRIILKEIIFNAFLAIMLLLSKLLFTADSQEPIIIYVAFIVLAEITFPIYDLALSRITAIYYTKIRPKIKIK